MANKPFEIQDSTLRLGGVDLQAGNETIVIPGVTQATSYNVTVGNNVGVQTTQWDIALPIYVVDNAELTRLNGDSRSVGYQAAVYAATLDSNGYITTVAVTHDGTFNDNDKLVANQNLWATQATDAINTFNISDWVEIPFLPSFRATTIENVGGGGLNNELTHLTLTATPPYTIPSVLSTVVDFERPNNSINTVDPIDTGLTLKRGNNGAIYNSAGNVETSWNDNVSPLGTEWNADGWGDLGDVKTRTYITFYEACDQVVGTNVVHKEFVMHDTINDKYYKIKFHFWQPNNGGGAALPLDNRSGFSYTRTLIDTTVNYYFVRTASDTGGADAIDTGLTIMRGSAGGIYNSDTEVEWDPDSSPDGTLWNDDGWTDFTDLSTRLFKPLYSAVHGQLGNHLVGRELIMRDTVNNKFYLVKFTEWGQNNGGSFAYYRRQIDQPGTNQGITFADSSQQTTALSLGDLKVNARTLTNKVQPAVGVYVEAPSPNSQYYNSGSWTGDANWITDGIGGIISFSSPNIYLQRYLNSLYGCTTRTVSINGGPPQNIVDWTNSYIRTQLPPDTDPTLVNNVEFYTTFPNRLAVDADDGNFGFSLDRYNHSFYVDSQDINLYAQDDLRIDAFNNFELRNNSATDSIKIVTDSDNTYKTWEFTSSGTIIFPNGSVQSTGYMGSAAAGSGSSISNGTSSVDIPTADSGVAVSTVHLATIPPITIVISDADFSAVNTTYNRDFALGTPTWVPVNYIPGNDPYIEFSNNVYGIFVPGFNQALYVNTGTLNNPLAQWNTNPPLGSVAPTGVYTNGSKYTNLWAFETDGSTLFPDGTIQVTAYDPVTVPGLNTHNSDQQSDRRSANVQILAPKNTIVILALGSETYGVGAPSLVTAVTGLDLNWTRRTQYTDPASGTFQTAEIWWAINTNDQAANGLVTITYDNPFDDQTTSVATFGQVNLQTPWAAQSPVLANTVNGSGYVEELFSTTETDTIGLAFFAIPNVGGLNTASYPTGWTLIEERTNGGAEYWEYSTLSYKVFDGAQTKLPVIGNVTVNPEQNNPSNGLTVILDALVLTGPIVTTNNSLINGSYAVTLKDTGKMVFPSDTIQSVINSDLSVGTTSSVTNPVGGSLAFTRTDNEFLSLNNAITLGTDPFTIEFWVNFQALTGYNTILSPQGGQGGVAVYIDGTSLVIDPIGVNNTWNLSSIISTGNWYHMAITRARGNISAWVNGIRVGNTQAECAADFGGNSYDIGKLWYGPSYSAFKLTNLRITSSEIYEPMAPRITVPTVQLTNVPYTQVLLLADSNGARRHDSSGTNGTYGTVVWDSSTPLSLTTITDHAWTFDADGNLTVPTSGAILSDNAINGVKFSLTNTDFVANKYVTIRGGGDNYSHLHIDSGDNLTYDVFLGDDDKFVKVDHTGSVDIQAQLETTITAEDNRPWYNIFGDFEQTNPTFIVNGSVTYDATGYAYVLSSTISSDYSEGNHLYLKYSPNGTLIWRKTWTDNAGLQCGSYNASMRYMPATVSTNESIALASYAWLDTISYIGTMDTNGNLVDLVGNPRAPLRIANVKITDIEADASTDSAAISGQCEGPMIAGIDFKNIQSPTVSVFAPGDIVNDGYFKSIVNNDSVFYAAVGSYYAQSNYYKCILGTVTSSLTTALYGIGTNYTASNLRGEDICKDPSGNLYVVINGNDTPYSGGIDYIIVASTNISNVGISRWQKKISHGYGLRGTGIVYHGGFVYLTAEHLTPSGGEIVLIKLDVLTGDRMWSRTFSSPNNLAFGADSPGDNSSSDSIVDPTGKYITISFAITIDGNNKNLTVQYPLSGELTGTFASGGLDELAISNSSFTFSFDDHDLTLVDITATTTVTSPSLTITSASLIATAITVGSGWANDYVPLTPRSSTWTFDVDGSLTPPVMSQTGYRYNYEQTGRTLQISNDSNSQVIITGPKPTITNPNAQRIVIQGRKGFDNTGDTDWLTPAPGEGGDVYLWGGTGGEGRFENGLLTGGSGGDIKLRGGQGQGTGDGGYVRIEGGYSDQGTGGFIDITAGNSSNDYGNLPNNGKGGDVNIRAGFRTDYSALTGDDGAVNVYTGQNNTNQWAFNPDGSLTFPDATVQTTAWAGEKTNQWVQDFSTYTFHDVPVIASSTEYADNGDIFALFTHETDSPTSYSSVARFTPDGSLVWSMRFNTDQYTNGWGLAVDNANGYVYVAGTLQGGIYNLSALTKINQTTGATVWSTSYDFGYDNRGRVVDVDTGGNPILVGFTGNGTDNSIFINKINPVDGTVTWSRTLNGQQNDEAYGMGVGPSSEVVVVGYAANIGNFTNEVTALYAEPAQNIRWANASGNITNSDINFDYTVNTVGEPTFSINADTLGGWAIGETVVTIPGTSFGVLSPEDDMVVKVGAVSGADSGTIVAKYQSNGTLLWQKFVRVQAGYNGNGADADIDQYGNVYVCGTFDNGGSTIMYLSKFDVDGNNIWTRRFDGDCTNNVSCSVVVGDDNYLYVSGTALINGVNNMFVGKRNEAGDLIWQRSLYNANNNGIVSPNFTSISGSNIAVKDGYLAIGGILQTSPLRALVAQFDTSGNEWSAGDYQWKSGVFNSSSVTPLVYNARKTSSTATPDVTTLTPTEEVSIFLLGRLTSNADFPGVRRAFTDPGNQTNTLNASHNGKFIYYSGGEAGSTLVVPNNSATPLPIGYTVSLVVDNFNNGSIYVNTNGDISNELTINAAGYSYNYGGGDGNHNDWRITGVGNTEIYTLMKVDTNRWILSGPTIYDNW